MLNFFLLILFFYETKNLINFSSPINTNEIDLKNLKSICSLKNDKIGNFWDVIDPKVSWDFLIGIFFLSVFKREKWLENLHVLNEDDLKDITPWSNFLTILVLILKFCLLPLKIQKPIFAQSL